MLWQSMNTRMAPACVVSVTAAVAGVAADADCAGSPMG
jgi:hypothetical protein